MGRKAKAETTGVNITEESIRTKRLEELASKKKKALEDLALAAEMERELGVANPTEEIQPEDLNGGAGTPLDRLTAIVEEIGGSGGYWEAYRSVNGAKTKLGRFDLDSWPDHLEVLAKSVGGGTIVVQFKDAGGVYKAQHTFSFDPATYKPEQAVQAAPKNDMEKFIEIMDRRDAQHKSELAEMRKENSELQKTILQSLIAKDPMANMAGMFKMMETLKQEQPKPLSVVKDLFETLSILRGHNTELEPPSPLEVLITKACDMLGPVLKAGLEKKLPEVAPSSPTPEALPVAIPPEPTAGPARSPQQSVLVLADNLLASARSGASPDTMASAFADKLTPQAASELKPFVDDPDIADKLILLKPELSQWKVWLVDFASLMKEYVDDILAPPEPEGSLASPN